MFYLIKTPTWLQKFFPDLLWRVPQKQPGEKILHLTFDDGPIPEITPWVLEILEKHAAKATFFVVGDNVRKHPQVFEKVKSAGHSIGNHTFNHLSGWKTDNKTYFENIEKCQALAPTPLFRPPYGRMRFSQSRFLKKKYRIVMWDVLSGDFDQKLAPEKCLDNVLKNIQPGSIIVFHDSLKAEKNLRYVLPKILDILSGQGWKFESLAGNLGNGY